MRLALRLAKRALGHTAPNPPVGAVLYREEKILGRGFHSRAGAPHAEIDALTDAKRRGHNPAGATLAVTLEPCSTHGRTPPCTESIKAAGISRVVIGCLDPNPAHAGRALQILRSAGIAVSTGVLEDECRLLIRCFARHITTGRPWVIAKIATSLDMRIAPAPGKPRTISGPLALRHAHSLRLLSDAILIGAGTLRTDDPALTIRHVPCPAHKPQPWRIVLTKSSNLPKQARIFNDLYRDRTLVMLDTPWPEILKQLGQRGVQTLLIEGGGITLASALHAGIVDELHHIVCPFLLGGPTSAFPGEEFFTSNQKIAATTHVTRLGSDILLRTLLSKP